MQPSAQVLEHRFISRSASQFATESGTSSPASPPSVKLYQYAICPFCNLAKALLSHARLDYEIVEVNPLTKAELKPWSGDYRKVPISIINGDQVNGSGEILKAVLDDPYTITALEKKWDSEESSSKMTMDDFRSEEAKKWMEFASEDLASLMYPNICRTLGDSFNSFDYVKNVEGFSPLQKISIRSIGAVAMWIAASKVKSRRGITDEKEALHSALTKWEEEGLNNGNSKFGSGKNSPDMGDLAVFGVVRSVEGMDAHTEAIEIRGGAIKSWYDRMQLEVYGKKSDHQI